MFVDFKEKLFNLRYSNLNKIISDNYFDDKSKTILVIEKDPNLIPFYLNEKKHGFFWIF